MTSDHDRRPAQEEWLRDAFARSRDAHPSSPAPVARILATARARRKRRRAAAAVGAVAGAACALATALAVSLEGPRPSTGPAQHSSPQVSPTVTASATAPPRLATVRVAEGTTDGKPWSVALEFHRTLPKGYELPTYPGGITVPANALLCQRMYIDGVRLDHQGGPWSDCQPVDGAHDPAGNGGMGLWGRQDKGTGGTRLMVSNPETAIAYGIVNLTDGTRLKARTATVPGTDYHAWAVAIPDGKTIAAVDQYDSRGHRVTHDTYWR